MVPIDYTDETKEKSLDDGHDPTPIAKHIEAAQTDQPDSGPSVSGIGLLSALSLALSACGGGGGGGGGPILSPPPPPVPMSTTEAARAKILSQFSFTDAELDVYKTMTFNDWLESEFNKPIGQTGVAWLDSQGHTVPKDDNPNIFDQTYGDNMIWNQLITGPDQLRKRCALALSEMMVVSLNALDGFWPSYFIASYWDTLTRNAFGNFRTLLEEITLNPAMGRFLNTAGNLKEDPSISRQPDENYAREVMQLFTIGLYELNNDGSYRTNLSGQKIETYTQKDITNLARVFTGYDIDFSQDRWVRYPGVDFDVPTQEFTRRPLKLDPNNHSNLEAKFLGTTIAANTEASLALRTALDTLFNHANVGPFFARQMIQRLVTSNPSPAYINRVASAFNNNGQGVRGDLKAVWRAIISDPEARNPPNATTSGKLREPIMRFVQWARTMNVQSTDGKWALWNLSDSTWGLGQSPLRAPSVFNFFRPGYVPPQTAIATQGLVAPEFQLHNETTTGGFLNFMMVMMSNGLNNIVPNLEFLYEKALDASALCDWLNLHFCGGSLSQASLDLMKNALNAKPLTALSPNSDKSDRINAATLMVLANPEYLIQK